MFEKHIEDWKIDLKLRRKQQIEGGNKDWNKFYFIHSLLL